MMNTGKLAGKTIFITGVSRGISLKAVKDGSNVVPVKTADLQPKLSRNVFPTSKEVQEAGGKALPFIVDVKDEKQGIRVISTLPTDMKRYEVSKACFIPLKDHISYTMVKWGKAEDSERVAVNTLWPVTSAKRLTSESFPIFKKYSQANRMSMRMMSSQGGESGVDGIFTSIKGRLNADIVSSTQAIFQFNITGGDKEETYHIDLRNGEGSAGKGKPSDSPDATLTMNTENFQKLFAGKLKPTAAFMTGKLKISGNMQKAMKLEKLLTSIKAKK